MKRIYIITFLLLGTIYSFAANPYLKEGTKEYTEVTAKLLGVWNVEFFGKGQDNKIGTVYKDGTVEFMHNKKKWTAVFRFTLPQSTIESRIAVWNKKGKTLSVDSYVVVEEYQFSIHKKGDIIYFDKPMAKPEIKGSGKQLKNFIGSETGFISSQSSLKTRGGLGNFVAAAALKSASGTDFVPKVPSQVNYKDLTDNSVDLVSIQKVNFKLTK